MIRGTQKSPSVTYVDGYFANALLAVFLTLTYL